MANHKSAKTRIKRNNKRAVINGARRSRVRTFVKKVITPLAASCFFLETPTDSINGGLNICHK